MICEVAIINHLPCPYTLRTDLLSYYIDLGTKCNTYDLTSPFNYFAITGDVRAILGYHVTMMLLCSRVIRGMAIIKPLVSPKLQLWYDESN